MIETPMFDKMIAPGLSMLKDPRIQAIYVETARFQATNVCLMTDEDRHILTNELKAMDSVDKVAIWNKANGAA